MTVGNISDIFRPSKKNAVYSVYGSREWGHIKNSKHIVLKKNTQKKQQRENIVGQLKAKSPCCWE
jgi:hypothetical protein